MAEDEHVAMLGRGATVWNRWRATHDEMPDLSRAGLRSYCGILVTVGVRRLTAVG